MAGTIASFNQSLNAAFGRICPTKYATPIARPLRIMDGTKIMSTSRHVPPIGRIASITFAGASIAK